MQVPLITSSLNSGAIYPQPCCPSPYHGFPSALGIEIPEDKKGDIPFAVEQITAKIAEKGGQGRFSTWPVPVAMMFIEGSADYAMAWGNGDFTEKVNQDELAKAFSGYAGTDISIGILEEGGETFDNFFTVLMDFLNF